MIRILIVSLFKNPLTTLSGGQSTWSYDLKCPNTFPSSYSNSRLIVSSLDLYIEVRSWFIVLNQMITLISLTQPNCRDGDTLWPGGHGPLGFWGNFFLWSYLMFNQPKKKTFIIIGLFLLIINSLLAFWTQINLWPIGHSLNHYPGYSSSPFKTEEKIR